VSCKFSGNRQGFPFLWKNFYLITIKVALFACKVIDGFSPQGNELLKKRFRSK